MGSRIRSYCTAGDPICDVGNPINTDAEAHLTYVDDYGQEVVAYVLEQYNNPGLSNGTSGRDGGAASTTATQESAGGRRLVVSVNAIAIPMIAFLLS